MISVDCILNVHRERPDVLRASLRSLADVLEEAHRSGVAARLTVMLDCADAVQSGLVKAFFDSLPSDRRGNLLESDLGDVGEARNTAIRHTDRPVVAFFDADDLWSRDWVATGVALLGELTGGPEVVVNSNFNVVFDEHHIIEFSRNMDCAEPLHSAMYAVANFSTSQVIASRRLFELIPFPTRPADQAFGFEDWEWSRLIADEGAVRRTAPGTVHFIRRESAATSLMRTLGARLPRPTNMIRKSDRTSPR